MRPVGIKGDDPLIPAFRNESRAPTVEYAVIDRVQDGQGTQADVLAQVVAFTERFTADALASHDYIAVFERLCQSMVDAGVPMLRAHLGMRTLHPMMASVDISWLRHGHLDVQPRPHLPTPPERWLQSPLYWMITRRQTRMRQDLRDPAVVERFPVFQEFAALGATDYYAALVPFGDPETAAEREDGVITSWLSDAPQGFRDRDILLLDRLMPFVGLIAKLSRGHNTTRNLMAAYLGEEVSQRVLAGQIRLGDVERIPAVIWFSDLRDSTAMAESMQPEAFLQTVNAYFQCTAGAVLECGGQVLRFIGDAVLAVFPIANGAEPWHAAQQAWSGCLEARQRMNALNAERQTRDEKPLAFGLGLHVGEVLYGNIGVPSRLEFSVIGTAANEVSRLESLTKQLGEPVLASRAFVDALPTSWRPMGRHRAAGVALGLEVFAPPSDPGGL